MTSAPKCPCIAIRSDFVLTLSGPVTVTLPFPSVIGAFAAGSVITMETWCVFFVAPCALMSTTRTSEAQGPIFPA